MGSIYDLEYNAYYLLPITYHGRTLVSLYSKNDSSFAKAGLEPLMS